MSQPNLTLGESGKYRVASELLKRNVEVFFAATDDGVDLFTEKGHGLQIKSVHASKADSRYHFNFKKWWRDKDGRKVQKYHGKLHPKVTHVVLWGVDEDLFWIIPISCFNGAKQISLTGYPKSGFGRFDTFINHWEQLI